jgi:hypothetical protein
LLLLLLQHLRKPGLLCGCTTLRRLHVLLIVLLQMGLSVLRHFVLLPDLPFFFFLVLSSSGCVADKFSATHHLIFFLLEQSFFCPCAHSIWGLDSFTTGAVLVTINGSMESLNANVGKKGKAIISWKPRHIKTEISETTKGHGDLAGGKHGFQGAIQSNVTATLESKHGAHKFGLHLERRLLLQCIIMTTITRAKEHTTVSAVMHWHLPQQAVTVWWRGTCRLANATLQMTISADSRPGT